MYTIYNKHIYIKLKTKTKDRQPGRQQSHHGATASCHYDNPRWRQRRQKRSDWRSLVLSENSKNILRQEKLEQLEHLRSEDTPAASWLPTVLSHIGSQVKKNNRSGTENVTEWTRFSKLRSNDLEDIGQGQRSSHATDLLMLVIICTKYGKNPSRTVDATERRRFSRSKPNDLENIGQGQMSLYATLPLILVIIRAKYGKNPWRTVDFFSRSRPKNWKILPKIQIFRFWKKRNTRHTL